jgi:hypothetical protein
MKITVNIMMVLSLILMTGLPLRADIPAPPVNQIIGINDGVFIDLTKQIAGCATKIPSSTRLKMKPNQIATIY